MEDYVSVEQYQALEKQVSLLIEQNKKLLDILEKLIDTIKFNNNWYIPIKDFQKENPPDRPLTQPINTFPHDINSGSTSYYTDSNSGKIISKL